MGSTGRREEWAGLVAIGLLTGLSVLGAFLGAGRARIMFNSPPVALFWLVLAGLLAARLVRLRTLILSPGVFAAWVGGLLVLSGGLYGSEMGHRLAERVLGRSKLPPGSVVLFRGTDTDLVLDRGLDHRIGVLPFSLRLDDLRIEYHRPRLWRLAVFAPGVADGGRGSLTTVEWELDRDVAIPHAPARLRVLSYSPGGADAGDELPAMELLLSHDGRRLRRSLVARTDDDIPQTSLAPLLDPDGGEDEQGSWPILFLIKLSPAVRRIMSDVAVLEGGRQVLRKTIEVNRPLHYGGYHFNQYDYDREARRFMVLLVRSDSGLALVYAGFGLLLVGVVWACWGRPVLAWSRSRGGD